MNERRRWSVLAAVVAVAAGAGALNAAFPRNAPSTTTSTLASPPSVGLQQAASTAWYCAGPLPVGPQSQVGSIAIANLLRHSLRGSVQVVRTSGASVTDPVEVPARSQVVVPLPRTGPSVYAAATVLLDGDGAAVEQIASGPSGTATSACADAPASTTYFPAGSTLGASNLNLALFNPSATPAVASVAVSTGSTSVAPPALQDLSVGAGQLVVLDVGHQVPQQDVIATTVTTSGGELVTGGMLVFPRHGGGVTEALTTGTATGARRWLFGPAPGGPGVHEVYAVLDPGSSPVPVVLHLGSGSATASSSLQAVVPAGGV
ncbi:MAG TPA: DUF5719 family protein, partial [Acidimicrobiales bacterium]|nr:DUF5719 family protein [Acidimicrobiales bacterium]